MQWVRTALSCSRFALMLLGLIALAEDSGSFRPRADGAQQAGGSGWSNGGAAASTSQGAAAYSDAMAAALSEQLRNAR
jgi:hypothetical protein